LIWASNVIRTRKQEIESAFPRVEITILKGLYNHKYAQILLRPGWDFETNLRIIMAIAKSNAENNSFPQQLCSKIFGISNMAINGVYLYVGLIYGELPSHIC